MGKEKIGDMEAGTWFRGSDGNILLKLVGPVLRGMTSYLAADMETGHLVCPCSGISPKLLEIEYEIVEKTCGNGG